MALARDVRLEGGVGVPVAGRRRWEDADAVEKPHTKEGRRSAELVEGKGVHGTFP